ncbi:hypothetical protein [Vibrio owensii]|uniref:hypothetical protein n=1 Tax=Vibrio owensii TaxID=696485 RepID=UPI0018F15619|nr:hypothetical protein [Vibrio owensii]
MDKSSGLIAEHHVICELYRNRYKCVQSPDPQNIGWDFIVIETPSKEREYIKLQVKGVRWQENTSTNPTITGDFSETADFHYLVVVVIDFSPERPYLTYVIPKECLVDKGTVKQTTGLLKKVGEKYYNNILFKGRSIAFSTFKKCEIKEILDRDFLDNWEQLHNKAFKSDS